MGGARLGPGPEAGPDDGAAADGGRTDGADAGGADQDATGVGARSHGTGHPMGKIRIIHRCGGVCADVLNGVTMVTKPGDEGVFQKITAVIGADYDTSIVGVGHGVWGKNGGAVQEGSAGTDRRKFKTLGTDSRIRLRVRS